ncbi:hypothetical protein [Lactococcus allomyrinae]|uniref:Uncharacterized protein n=1 Tax=Lactococcus allomyrinae TaxID=2419773 RepID=A0A387BJW6_9LACT|nr:hypothetical protein [Lactococcus allomyrinae]AYG01337.1 hypothetical protein D7I46_09660 [Lactococcus allomyrinae]
MIFKDGVNDLTKKQTHYYVRIDTMVVTRSRYSKSYEEKRALFLARDSINSHQHFGTTMRILIARLRELEMEQKEGLSPQVKELFEDLKKDYDF